MECPGPLSNEKVVACTAEPDESTKEFIFQQTMYRIKDPEASLKFYSNVLGMRLQQVFTPFPPMEEDFLEDDPLPDQVPVEPEQDSRTNRIVRAEIVTNESKRGRPRLVDVDGYTYNLRHTWPNDKLLNKLDVPPMKFTVYFMGYEQKNDIPKDEKERTEWSFSRKGTLELTHNWGTEKDENFSYHNGNSEPRGYGHIGIMVPDVNKACERFESLGVTFAKKPNDGKMKGLAFVKDPDGYLIEILNNKALANMELS